MKKSDSIISVGIAVMVVVVLSLLGLAYHKAQTEHDGVPRTNTNQCIIM